MKDSCIYCGEHKPFTAEHVVSAGIGGDDPNWMLEDCVCGDCNTKIFSPLENKTFRSSPVALSRIFLQPHTRGHTGKSSTPVIQPRVSYHDDPETGILFEQVIQAGGQPVMLPQIAIASGGRLVACIPDVEAGKAFIAAVKERLVSCVQVVQKFREGVEVHFDQTTLEWKDNSIGYQVIGGPQRTQKAPKEPIVWLEEPVWLAGIEEGDYTRLPPRAFRRESGQISVRASSIHVVAGFLSILHSDIDQISIDDNAQPSSTQSHVHQQFAFDIKSYDRVLAKIGVNLCAKLKTAGFVRQSGFDRVRDYIVTGNGAVMKRFVSEDDNARNALGPLLKNHHVFMICGGPGKDSQSQCAVFFCRLYGGPIEIFRLAEFETHQPELASCVIVVVDYIAQKIWSMSVEEYASFAVQNAAEPIENFFAEK